MAKDAARPLPDDGRLLPGARGVSRRGAGRRRSRRRVRPKRSRAAAARRRGISPWPLILLLAALLAIGAVVAASLHPRHGSARARRPPAARAAAGRRHAAAVAADDPLRHRRRARRRRRAGDRQQPVHLLGDRATTAVRRPRQTGCRARARREQAGGAARSSGSRPRRRASPRSSGQATRRPRSTEGDLVVADRERRHDVHAAAAGRTATTRSGSRGSAAGYHRRGSTKSGHPELSVSAATTELATDSPRRWPACLRC